MRYTQQIDKEKRKQETQPPIAFKRLKRENREKESQTKKKLKKKETKSTRKQNVIPSTLPIHKSVNIIGYLFSIFAFCRFARMSFRRTFDPTAYQRQQQQQACTHSTHT